MTGWRRRQRVFAEHCYVTHVLEMNDHESNVCCWWNCRSSMAAVTFVLVEFMKHFRSSATTYFILSRHMRTSQSGKIANDCSPIMPNCCKVTFVVLLVVLVSSYWYIIFISSSERTQCKRCSFLCATSSSQTKPYSRMHATPLSTLAACTTKGKSDPALRGASNAPRTEISSRDLKAEASRCCGGCSNRRSPPGSIRATTW